MEAIELLQQRHHRQMDELRKMHRAESRKLERELKDMDRNLSRLRRQIAELDKPQSPPLLWTQLKWVFNILL
ncbi:MAG: hypothetical protein H0S85_10675 [Desulfovibrionaceae bacterium]|jgi:CRISPR/Cas system-associated protein Cas10 (large subunit of type III CRISPR-Cas system)|nr:hypothetical protein [Desulfovibrionaceae bacterium]